MKRIIHTIVMSLLLIAVHSQEKITLDQAITIALENNYDIKIEHSNLAVATEEFNKGNAGYYPTVSANASYERSSQNMEAEYNLGMMSDAAPGESTTTMIEGNGVNSTNYSAGLGFNYKLYEGGAKKYRYKNLETAHLLSELQLNNQIEMSIVEVATAYLEVARANANLEIAIENMEISQERWQRAEINAAYGTISDLVLLQSLSFLNNDSIAFRSTEVTLKNAQRQLNLALGQDINTAVAVYSEVELLQQAKIDVLLKEAMQHNTLIIMSNSRIGLSQTALDLAQSAYYPTLDLSGQYGYFKQENEQNLIVYQQNLGFTGGATLSIPIFTGNQRRTQVRTAKIRISQEQQIQEKTMATVKTNLLDTYEQYKFFINQLSTEERNITLYKKNFTKATEDYTNGVISSTEVRETQNNYAEAKLRISNLQYNIKLYELILRQLTGQLVESQS